MPLRGMHRRRANVGAVAHLLGAEAVHLEYPTQVVFESTTVGVSDGDRIGVVGRNGDGKSSLLGLLSGQVRPDSGRVTRRSGLRIGALSQADILDSGQRGGLDAGTATAATTSGPAIRVSATWSAGWSLDISWDAKVGTLSGGQRRRVQLAALLVGDWDVIALDEPTNHPRHRRHHLAGRSLASALGQQHRRTADGDPRPLVPPTKRATATWEVHVRKSSEPFEGGYAAYVLQRVERDRHGRPSPRPSGRNLMRKELAWLAPRARRRRHVEAEVSVSMRPTKLIADVPPLRNTPSSWRNLATRPGSARMSSTCSTCRSRSTVHPVLRDVEWRIGPR